jgi:hypothetical protein
LAFVDDIHSSYVFDIISSNVSNPFLGLENPFLEHRNLQVQSEALFVAPSSNGWIAGFAIEACLLPFFSVNKLENRLPTETMDSRSF